MIFNKMFLSFIIILIISFTILGGILYSFLGNYTISEKEAVLLSAAHKISDMSSNLVSKKYEDYSEYYQLSIDLIAYNLNCEIILANRYGTVITKTSQNIIETPIVKMPSNIVNTLNEGNIARSVGKASGFGKSALTIAVPVYYNDKVIAGVYLITNIPKLSKLKTDVLRMYIISVIAAFLIAFFVILYLSKKITNPINAIIKASKLLSSGEFNARVKVYKNDEIGELAIAFNKMADSLSKQEEMRRSFVSDVSHELRTPMTTITGFIQGVLDGTIPEDKRDMYLKIALDESKRLSKLVSDLLEISKLSSDEVKLETTVFDINELIRLTIIAFEAGFNEKKLTVNAVFENQNEFVIAQKDSIKRVLTNLIDNAIKFSYEGGNIDIKTYSKGEKINVSIRNEGEGISEEDQKTIFERFYKLDKSRSQTGVGLGLYMVKNIIEKHKEKIFVRSVKGSYAEFTFTLKKSKII